MSGGGQRRDEPRAQVSIFRGRGRLLIFGSIIFAATILGGLKLSGRSAATGENSRSPERAAAGARIVSLSPGVTDTIVELGSGDQIVGVSDYCRLPEGSAAERTGSAITPNYEAIAQLAPSVIITSEVKGGQLSPLSKLAKTHALPWLTLDEWSRSIVRLGDIIARPQAAQALSDQITTTLRVAPPQDGPRILLALDYGDSGSNEIWFIRTNSIHGAVLSAAGARNAVSRDVTGPPKLSPEELLAIDPDGVLVLSERPQPPTDEEVFVYFSRWEPLQAVKRRRIGVVPMGDALTVGPSVLKLVPLLREKINAIMRAPQ